jgi:hypothetical protein
MTASRPPRFRSFLLRCWEEVDDSEDEAGVWRFSLEEPGGKRLGFSTIKSLMQFLEQDLYKGQGHEGS